VKLLFVVEQTIFLEGYGLLLAPGVPREQPIGEATPLFLIRPDGTHVTALARAVPNKNPHGPHHPVAVDLLAGEVPVGTRVFGRGPEN
jgi:hypothetical protein